MEPTSKTKENENSLRNNLRKPNFMDKNFEVMFVLLFTLTCVMSLLIIEGWAKICIFITLFGALDAAILISLTNCRFRTRKGFFLKISLSYLIFVALLADSILDRDLTGVVLVGVFLIILGLIGEFLHTLVLEPLEHKMGWLEGATSVLKCLKQHKEPTEQSEK